jgi:hypothetical protein
LRNRCFSADKAAVSCDDVMFGTGAYSLCLLLRCRWEYVPLSGVLRGSFAIDLGAAGMAQTAAHHMVPLSVQESTDLGHNTIYNQYWEGSLTRSPYAPSCNVSFQVDSPARSIWHKNNENFILLHEVISRTITVRWYIQ